MILLSAIALFIYRQTIGTPVIRTITGVEWEYLTIRGNNYEADDNAPVRRTDKGSFLGVAVSGTTRFRIYSIKGSVSYLYCQWEWEGRIYERKPSVQAFPHS